MIQVILIGMCSFIKFLSFNFLINKWILIFYCSPDPLVLVAWKCTKLVEIVLLGHKYHQENLLAIARLRGHSLKSLVFAQRFITSGIESWYKAETITHVSFYS